MTTTATSPATKITALKHAIAGRDNTFIATVTKLTEDQVRQVLSAHGYPDMHKMQWAIDTLEKQTDQDSDLVTTAPLAEGVSITSPTAPASPALVTSPAPLTRPDEIRVLLNTAKASKSKRAQSMANKILDHVGLLRDLIKAEQQKTHEAAEREHAKAAAKAEVERLERELKAAKARLTGRAASTPTATATATSSHDPKAVREWAAANDVDCPSRGRVPQTVLDAYDQAHGGAAA